jgi:hypothetical protein
MVMQISNSMSFAPMAGASTRPPEQQQAFQDLRRALRSDDLDTAKQAYVNVVRNAPDGATWNPDSPFAQVGKALVAGDMEAAKSAYAAMVKSHIPRYTIDPPLAPVSEPASFSADATAPGQLHLTA